jgi:hypothetical protein
MMRTILMGIPVRRRLGVATLAAATLLAACGNGDEAEKTAKTGGVGAVADATGDLNLDASTADAMSVDVAAGGIEPAVDPAAAPDTSATAGPAPTAAPAEATAQ